MPISAKVILKSSSQYATKPLCTFELRYPKFIHSEFMTHRMLSRNASSSRAIPTSKLLEEVRNFDTMAKPIFWGKNQKGMQAAEELTTSLGVAKAAWNRAAHNAADSAQHLMGLGAHKQIVNRILEPFSHINVVATATEWDNFFGLRLHWMAQPEMRHLAELMWKAYNEAESQELAPDEWHLPYIDWFQDASQIHEVNYDPTWTAAEDNKHRLDLMIKMSVARCARVSYKQFDSDKRSTAAQDMETYKKLNIPGTEFYQPSEPIHASPAEHQATPDTLSVFCTRCDEYKDPEGWNHKQEHGNFVGWRQYRKQLPGESCAPLPDEYLPF